MTIHRNTARPRLDIASLVLTFIGLIFGSVAYWLITAEHVTALVIVPAVVAFTIGVTHLTKREAPRE
jgi:uncharacterized membrane protein YccC